MKTIALFILALALVGCSQKGGTGDDYDTDRGRSSTNLPPPGAYDTNQTPNQAIPRQP